MLNKYKSFENFFILKSKFIKKYEYLYKNIDNINNVYMHFWISHENEITNNVRNRIIDEIQKDIL